jgi:hypothetical protein
MFGKRKNDVDAGISSPDCGQEMPVRKSGTESAKDTLGERAALSFLEACRPVCLSLPLVQNSPGNPTGR